MNEINLEEIYSKIVEISNHGDFTTISKDSIIEFAKEACRQTLELATENADLEDYTDVEANNTPEDLCFIISIEGRVWGINKQSILDTINQIK